ncbi:prolipoprotein diacylglyceryl transferase [Streptacidiphilus griseoplanus]|uniref:prolipoprotein diacylglyceryl transferase n=1 Tax=Peterkaempfera griseoplana TaxID=66896 RepID=UPI0006E3B95F|nr:prolipoprotein diacylglyceryl transferase [Peterkaempfera griseoplana]
MDLAFIPSPSRGVIHLGPIPLRAYAFCIIIGVVVAVWLGSKRWVARGGASHTVGDVAVWAVPFGLVGGRLYHVITDHQLYFDPGKHPIDALKIWNGGLGIWGAIALGALGAWIGCRRAGVPLPAWADAVAPGIALAQACGRWGNWFNQELFGKPTTLPWGLTIDYDHRPDATKALATYHPTFLYESLWCIGVAVLVIWADRRFRLGHGRAFALYVAAYTVGRFWIEYLRVDEAHHILGLRLNDWTSIVVFLGAVVYLVLSAKRHPGRETDIDPAARAAVDDPQDGGPTGSADRTDGAEAADVTDGGDALAPEDRPKPSAGDAALAEAARIDDERRAGLVPDPAPEAGKRS